MFFLRFRDSAQKKQGVLSLASILFHLHSNFTNYISVLVNELTHAIAVELTEQTSSPVTVSECLHSLVAAASNEEETR